MRTIMSLGFLRVLSALSLLAFSTASSAAPVCSKIVEGNDAMQFDTKAITVDKSCKQFTLTLKHTGKLPKAVMGHNFVVAKPADVQAVSSREAADSYVKVGDARLIAHTKVIGGGESDSVVIPVAQLNDPEGYLFFCSVPGHSAMMRGTITVK